MYHYDLEKTYQDQYGCSGLDRKIGIALGDEGEVKTLQALLSHFSMYRDDYSYFNKLDQVVQGPGVTEEERVFLSNRAYNGDFYSQLEGSYPDVVKLLPKIDRMLQLLELCEESLLMVSVADSNSPDAVKKGRMIKIKDYLDGKIDRNTLQEWRLENESQQKDSN